MVLAAALRAVARSEPAPGAKRVHWEVQIPQTKFLTQNLNPVVPYETGKIRRRGAGGVALGAGPGREEGPLGGHVKPTPYTLNPKPGDTQTDLALVVDESPPRALRWCSGRFEYPKRSRATRAERFFPPRRDKDVFPKVDILAQGQSSTDTQVNRGSTYALSRSSLGFFSIRATFTMGSALPSLGCAGDVISQKVFIKLFRKSQFPHKFVNLFFMFVIIQDKFTICGGVDVLNLAYEYMM